MHKKQSGILFEQKLVVVPSKAFNGGNIYNTLIIRENIER